ncbi:MAG: hypothetical protein AAF871_12460 [Pseudomonadota bacterium]
MSDSYGEIVRRLEAALNTPGIPDAARANGRSLFDILSRPVRVAILGMAGSGKTAVLNMFLGERLIPQTLSSTFLEIVPGPDFMAEASYPDGRLEAADVEDLDDVVGAERVLIAAPNTILASLSMMEASVDGNAADNIASAAKAADILLWCTTEFNAAERALWEGVEERFQDHAFLLVTKADKLARADRLADTLMELAPLEGTEFAGILPLATLQALRALETEPRDPGLWQGSGADAVISTVSDHAKAGRRADLDQAELFLARYCDDFEETEDGIQARVRSRPKSQAVRKRSRMTRERSTMLRRPESEIHDTEAAPRSRRIASRPSSETKSPEKAPRPVSEPAPKAAPDPSPAPAPKAEAPATEQPADSPNTLADRLGQARRTLSRSIPATPRPKTVIDTAIQQIAQTGTDLARITEDPERILRLCAETTDGLQTLLDEDESDVELDTLPESVAQSAEMMTLLLLENAPGPAADAVTLLLQLKRDFEARLPSLN